MEQKNGSASARNGPDKLPDKGSNNGKSEDEKKEKDKEPQKMVGLFEVVSNFSRYTTNTL